MKYFTDPKQLGKPKVISLDTEYSNIEVRHADLLSISIGTSSDDAGIFHSTDLAIKECLQSAEIIFTQNGKVDWRILKQNGLELDRSKFIDTMLMEHLIDENIEHSLGAMAVRYFEDDYKSQFWGSYDSYQEAPREEQLDYELRDAIYTFRLGKRFYSDINNPELIKHVHRLYWALADTEFSGIEVDTKLMQDTKIEMGGRIDGYLPALRETFKDACNLYELNEWLRKINLLKTDAGKARVPKPEFNFGSDAQIRWLLFDHLNLAPIEKTKKGQPKADYATLTELVKQCLDLKPLVEYKEIKNVYSTFVEGMLDRVEQGRIYPSFNVNGTRNAGRISHSNPNMGNIPAEGPIRSFFLPSPGSDIVGADYAQLEVVVEANLTEDKSLLKIINEGASKHDITAEGLGITRDEAKTLNFALQYGAGSHKVSKLLKISHKDAEDVFKRYWELYSGVYALKQKTEKELEETGKVSTLFGRSRHFPKPENDFEKAKFSRQAYNAVIQGTGADCTNRATYIVSDYLKLNKIGRLWFSVHDEIVAEAQNSYTEQVKNAIVKSMEGVTEYVGFKYSLHAKPYGPFTSWRKT